ncbi:BA75_03352T0 [Komagataella pastoris]|uniref:BA75_03352T0 n=1 Tax=Komagataella pastoris TaxID=4922 RepID=A0A1B2JF11_PICPA|nr:BA75_03352T0 [Komagataella pastoris]
MQMFALFIWITSCIAMHSKSELLGIQKRTNDGILSVNSSKFNGFCQGPRDYFIVALFADVENEAGCKISQEFVPVFEKVVGAYMDDYGNTGKAFFAILDYSDIQHDYQDVSLLTVPQVWIYPPTNKMDYSTDYDSKPGDHACCFDETTEHLAYQIPESLLTKSIQENSLEFAQFLAEILQIQLYLKSEFDMSHFISYLLGLFLLTQLIRKRRDKIRKRLAGSYIWQVLSLVSILISISGYNFCSQRGVPFLPLNDKGARMFLSGGQQYQFGSEVLISIVVYLSLAICVIVLICIPRISNPLRRNFGALFFATFLFLGYNILTSIFIIKNPSYPFNFINIPIF